MPTSELAVPPDLKKSHEGDKHGDKDCGRHGDIKPQNILWFTEELDLGHGTLKISDFGLTAFHSELTTKVVPGKVRGLTQSYAAPEFDTGPHVSRPYDIWSLGCIFIDFITWVLLGYEGVEKFASKRRKDQSFNNRIRMDDFYRLSEGMFRWRRKESAFVKRSVKKVSQVSRVGLSLSNLPFFFPGI
jgi:serine/threonine protein kinase